MLTISKPLTAAQAQNYHKKEFTAKEQNYWGRGEQIPGTWQGRLAGQYGLPERVGEEEFARLSQGQHPLTGEQLYDITPRTNTSGRTAPPSLAPRTVRAGTRPFRHLNPYL